MELRLHHVGIEVDVGIHRAQVHLVRIACDTVILRVEAARILDERFLQLRDVSDIVLASALELDGLDVAICFEQHRTVFLELRAQFLDILAIIALHGEDCRVDIAVHHLRPVRPRAVQRFLLCLDALHHRDFVRVVLERDERDARPRLRLVAVCHRVKDFHAALDVRHEAAILENITLHGFFRVKLHMRDRPFLAPFIGKRLIVADGAIELRVLRILPEWEDFMCRELLELHLPTLVVVREHPCQPFVDGIDRRARKHPFERAVEDEVQLLLIGVIRCRDSERLA